MISPIWQQKDLLAAVPYPYGFALYIIRNKPLVLRLYYTVI
jgi:hypothetical protein